MLFNGPIPGQSLTKPEKGYPWERPPEMTDPGKAVAYHMEKFSDPDIQKGFLDAIQRDIPISILAKMATTHAVSEGIYNLDLQLMIKPVVHEYLTTLAEASELSYKEFFEDEDTSQQEMMQIASKEILKSLGQEVEGPAEEYLEDVAEETDEAPSVPVDPDRDHMEEEVPEEPEVPKKGLGAKRGMNNV